VIVLKDYDGKTRPSKIMFCMKEPWVRIKDLPLYKRSSTFGNALGNWLGDVVKVDVEKDGFMGGTVS
jgi:hypothetical protein